ncbi:MarR family winged helix-turn-helix transcriptional regulator [Conexibacter sp. S30A1]|uniref:MarR family winged helix-turn-helix transcriptional regulator n=1 Tax=Conexibacter sp. S30A1 TaxID=2937800 RepID=UPI00200E60E2|nr:MarR family winged helix-turn-helix transcriptional regulator [Conexibacter sp. S30A1]
MSRFPEGPASSPGFLLWRLTLSWQRAITSALAPTGLTHVQFVLLACTWWLTDQGDAPNQLQLAHQAGTDPKMTSQVLRKLEAKGLLTREIDPADTRARRLRLTAQGVGLALRAITIVEDIDAQFFDGEEAITPTLQRLLAQEAGLRPGSSPGPERGS